MKDTGKTPAFTLYFALMAKFSLILAVWNSPVSSGTSVEQFFQQVKQNSYYFGYL